VVECRSPPRLAHFACARIFPSPAAFGQVVVFDERGLEIFRAQGPAAAHRHIRFRLSGGAIGGLPREITFVRLPARGSIGETARFRERCCWLKTFRPAALVQVPVAGRTVGSQLFDWH